VGDRCTATANCRSLKRQLDFELLLEQASAVSAETTDPRE